ncbi:MAG: hypothetical protein HYX78_11200, partial [Armatimonadetes bacterium]|nr:hypothetical protein [Armatimonadota bacterium]
SVVRYYDTVYMRLYADGVQVASTYAPGNLFQGSGPLDIGHPEGWFDGSIDEVKIWNEARAFSPISDPSPEPQDTPFLILGSAPFFPIGLYGVPPTLSDNEMREITDSGFNCIMSDRNLTNGGWLSFLNRSQQFGLKTLVTLYDQDGTGPWGMDLNEGSIYDVPIANDRCARRTALVDTLGIVRDHPALLAYHALDGISRYGAQMEGLLEGRSFVKDQDSTHSIWLNHSSSVVSRSALADYNRLGDAVSADIRPVPASAGQSKLANTTVSCVGEYTQLIRESVGYSKPVWMVLQAHKWPAAPDSRFPTAAELRFMTYDAIINGANGIIYYSYHPKATQGGFNSGDEPYTPEFWSALKQVAGELSSLGARITAQSAAGAVVLDTHSTEVEVLAKRHNGRLTVMAANKTGSSLQGVTLRLANNGFLGSVNVLFESRYILPSGQSVFQDNFAPYDVHVYDFLEPPSGDNVWIRDDFDGVSPLAPDWVNATDDGGQFVLDAANGVFVGQNVGSPYTDRASYAYFVLPQEVIDAGYTYTVKGAGVANSSAEEPFIGLTWQTTDWNHGNWFMTSSGGNVVKYSTTSANSGGWLGGGGASANDQWFWMRAVVNGNTSRLYHSSDGTNYTYRGQITSTNTGSFAGVLTGAQTGTKTKYDFVEVRSPAAQSVMVSSISGLREIGDGVSVNLSGQIVSAVLADSFYIQEPDRSCGIKVLGTVAAQRGSAVQVTGILGTAGCERYIDLQTAQVTGSGAAPQPLGLANAALGGTGLLMTPGIGDGTGLSNVGLLVRTWGVVRDVVGTQPNVVFYLDDGSNRSSDGGQIGVKVYTPGPAPQVGNVAIVTGISSCESAGGASVPTLRARDAADVQAL